MLRGARRQETAHRRKPAPALPARLTEDAWWLDAPQPQPAPRAATTAPRLIPADAPDKLPAAMTAQVTPHE
jgi:hypothetical protein